jgi:Amt family ammonium transporter
MTGAVAGLATITPAAGYVNIYSAALIGIVASTGCFFAVRFKDRRGWDDALDVWGVHGMGGVIGTLCLGLFATKSINPAVPNGLLYGGGIELLAKETIAILLATSIGFLFTLGIFKAINRFIPVKVTKEEQEIGLDLSLHGEVARQ